MQVCSLRLNTSSDHHAVVVEVICLAIAIIDDDISVAIGSKDGAIGAIQCGCNKPT